MAAGHRYKRRVLDHCLDGMVYDQEGQVHSMVEIQVGSEEVVVEPLTKEEDAAILARYNKDIKGVISKAMERQGLKLSDFQEALKKLSLDKDWTEIRSDWIEHYRKPGLPAVQIRAQYKITDSSGEVTKYLIVFLILGDEKGEEVDGHTISIRDKSVW